MKVFEIKKYFDSLPIRAFLERDIDQILAREHKTWDIRTDFYSVLENLKTVGLNEIILTSPNYDKTYKRFFWGLKIPIYHLGLSLRPRSYLSHYSAMVLHGLTDMSENRIYVNQEQSMKADREAVLTQRAIDMAFKGKPRTSKYVFTFENWEILCLNGANTKNLGVEPMNISGEDPLSVTDLERTLIDITVRPVYSGGCNEVLKAYRQAKDRIVVDRVVTMLKKINHVYPYHQAIGFYMQLAGFDGQSLKKLKKLGLEHDFYLAHDMKTPKYSKEWRINYPRNL